MAGREILAQLVEQLSDAEVAEVIAYITFLKLRASLVATGPQPARSADAPPAAAPAASTPTLAEESALARAASDPFLRAVRAWADEVVEVMSEAIGLAGADVPFDEAALRQRRFAVRHRLSALVDRGRWLLPNVAPDQYGVEKEAAYRGIRPAALDPIVVAFKLVGRATGDDPALDAQGRQRLISLKREFVSHVQTILKGQALRMENSE